MTETKTVDVNVAMDKVLAVREVKNKKYMEKLDFFNKTSGFISRNNAEGQRATNLEFAKYKQSQGVVDESTVLFAKTEALTKKEKTELGLMDLEF